MSKHISVCIVGHRKMHRGLFSRQRMQRWWRKHDHPEFVDESLQVFNAKKSEEAGRD